MGVISSHHLFVCITKEGRETDRTFISLKPLILIPYVIVSESDAVDYIKTLLSAKQLYYTIRNEDLEDKIEDEQLNEMFDMLHIDNFNNEYLHTVILLDDIFRSANNLLKEATKCHIYKCFELNYIIVIFIDFKMTYYNAQTKNTGNNEGDVLSFFQNKMRNLIQRNGGDHSFSFIMEEFTNKDIPMPVGTRTRTHSGHTITQIEKSFSTILLDFALQSNETIDVSADVNGIHKLFVGFKNVVEFYQEFRFWVDGKLLDSYRQDELQRYTTLL